MVRDLSTLQATYVGKLDHKDCLESFIGHFIIPLTTCNSGCKGERPLLSGMKKHVRSVLYKRTPYMMKTPWNGIGRTLDQFVPIFIL